MPCARKKRLLRQSLSCLQIRKSWLWCVRWSLCAPHSCAPNILSLWLPWEPVHRDGLNEQRFYSLFREMTGPSRTML